MNIKISIFAFALLTLVFVSCKKNFLDITSPNDPTVATYYSSLQNAQNALDGVYAETHDEHLFRGEIYYVLDYSTGEMHYNHGEAWYLNFNNTSYDNTNSLIAGFYKEWFRLVGKSNSVLNGLKTMEGNTSILKDSASRASLKYMQGQCYFLRALGYYYLIRCYGEKMPSQVGYNRDLNGVPIADTLFSTPDQLLKGRNTCGEVYDEIIRSLKIAENLLPLTWPDDQAGRVTKRSAQAYLGEVYVYLKDWANAKVSYDKIINDKSYVLENFYDNFDYSHLYNKESLFEVGFNDFGGEGTYLYRLVATQSSWNTSNVRHEAFEKFVISVEPNATTMKDSAIYTKGFTKADRTVFRIIASAVNANFLNQVFPDQASFINALSTVIPDMSILYIAGSTDMKPGAKFFIDMISIKDPRLYGTMYIPFKDSIWNWVSGGWKGFKYPGNDYGIKKYIPNKIEVDHPVISGQGTTEGAMSMNFRVMRLTDVYLKYAEVLANTSGMESQANDYLNLLVERAYKDKLHKLPFKTGTALLDEIKRQTFLETALECKWWFDVRRWDMGEQEFKNYGYVKDKSQCFPIPQVEIQLNPLLKQNDYY